MEKATTKKYNLTNSMEQYATAAHSKPPVPEIRRKDVALKVLLLLKMFKTISIQFIKQLNIKQVYKS
jgi:hypothetical protein